jgi:hypothetical protein
VVISDRDIETRWVWGTPDPSPTPLLRTTADCSPTRISKTQIQIHLVMPVTTAPMFPTMTRRTQMAMEKEMPVTTTWMGMVQPGVEGWLGDLSDLNRGRDEAGRLGSQ